MSMKVTSNDEEYDIYSDLPNFQVTESIAKLESKNKCLLDDKRKLSDTVEALQKMIDVFRKQKAELESKYKCLSFNMSALYKTAASELRRKDRMIEELRREHDNTVFRRRSFKSNEERYDRYESRRKRRYSDPANVDWNEPSGESKEHTAKKLKVHDCNKNNRESSHATQNKYNEVPSENATTKKHIPSYTGPLTEYSKRMFAKMHGISVDAVICDSETPDNCIKEQKYKESIYNKDNQYSDTHKCKEKSTDNPCKSETNTANMSQSMAAPAPKTPATKKVRTPKLDRRCFSLRGKQHPTDLIKLGAQNIVKAEEKKNMQENVSIEASNKQRITPNRKHINNQAKDEIFQDTSLKDGTEKSSIIENAANLKLDTGQSHELREGSEHTKQDQNRIKQLLHDSHKFLTKAKTIRSNKIIITPTSGYSDIISTVSQEDMSSPDTEKIKSADNKSPSLSIKPNVVNSNRKSRQAQLLASLFNSPEPNELRSDGDSNARASKTAKSIFRQNIPSIMKSIKSGKTPPKGHLDDRPADATPKRQTNLLAERETKIPGDIISPILAKISENVCKLPILKNKIANQDVPVNTKKSQCPRTAVEKLIQNVTENSCSIMGEDTLGMVTSLARSRQTVSPIKTPDKDEKLEKTSPKVGQEHLQKEKKSPLNFSSISKHSLLQKGTETKSFQSPSSLVSKNQYNAILKKTGVSVCLSSEHGEFKRKRLLVPVTSETDDSSPEKRTRVEDHDCLEKQDGSGSKVKKMTSTEENEKISHVPMDKIAVQGSHRNRLSDGMIDLKTVGFNNNNNKIEKIENNSGKENNEETEILRKLDVKSPGHKGRDSHSQRRLSRRIRYSPYRHRRRSPLRSFERNMRRRTPGYLRHSDRRRSHRARSITPLRFRSRKSRTNSPIRLRSKRSVSLSPIRLLKKERYHKQSKISNNIKAQEKIENRLHDDSFSEELVGREELEDSDSRDEIDHEEIAELRKFKSIIKHIDAENSKVIDRSSIHQIPNIDKVSTLVENNKLPLSKQVKSNIVSVSGVCSDNPIQKSSSEINVATASKTEKECMSLNQNIVTLATPVLKVADTQSPVVIMKRRNRKVIRLEDNETTPTVSIKSPKKSNEVKSHVSSETKEQTVTDGNNTSCIDQKETVKVTTENMNINYKNVHNRTVKNMVSSDNVKSNKVLCVVQEQKETVSTVISENVNAIHDIQTVKSKMPDNIVSSIIESMKSKLSENTVSSVNDSMENKLPENIVSSANAIMISKQEENVVSSGIATMKSKRQENIVSSSNVTMKSNLSQYSVSSISDSMKSKVSKNKVPSVNDKTSDIRKEVKDDNFVLTRENVQKLNNYYSSSGKKTEQTPEKKEKEKLYMALFGTPNSKCSSDSTETEEGELSSSSNEGD